MSICDSSKNSSDTTCFIFDGKNYIDILSPNGYKSIINTNNILL